MTYFQFRLIKHSRQVNKCTVVIFHLILKTIIIILLSTITIIIIITKILIARRMYIVRGEPNWLKNSIDGKASMHANGQCMRYDMQI